MTPERFARSLTFDDYVSFTGSPEKLRREGFDIRVVHPGPPRPDWSGYRRVRSATARPTDDQPAAQSPAALHTKDRHHRWHASRG